MATKKYVTLNRLSTFLDNLSKKFASLSHKHTVEDISNYKIDNQLSSTSVNPVQNKVLDAEFEAISEAMQVYDAALNDKSDKSHTHNISNITNLQSALDGKANSSHGTHVTYSTTAPVMDGTASVGSANTVARSDHKHPTDTSRASQTSLDSHTNNTTSHITSTERTNWGTAYTHSQSAHARTDATKVADSTTNGNILINGTETNVYTHPNSGVSAGAYKSVTVNAQGHITSGSNPTTLSGYGITDAETKTDASNKLNEAKTYADNAANAVKNDLLNGAGDAYNTLKELGDLIDDNTDAIDALETVAAGKADKTHAHAISDVTNLQSTLDGKATSGHTHNSIVSRGNTQAETETTRPSVSGLSMTQAYNNGYPQNYGNVLNLKGQGDGQLLIGWSGTSGSHAPLHVRSKRDVSDANWSDWAQIYTTAHKPTPTDIGAAASSHTHKVANITDLTASATELNYVKGVTSGIQTQLDSKSSSGHTHNYAGSSSVGGAATSANKLNTDAGSTTQPVYFANGVPVKTTYTLSKSVPSNAVFTDTHYTSKNVIGSNSAVSNTTTALTNGNVYLNSVENGVVTSSHKISGSGATTVTTDTSGNIVISSTNTTYGSAGSSLGLVKSGGDVTISSGVITVNDDSHNHTIANVDNLQTSLDAKQATITGGATTIASSNLTANRALISNGSGKVAVSDVTSTELGYLDGVTSNVQTQIDGKANTSHTHSYAGSSSAGGSANSAVKLQTARSIALGNDLTGSANFDGSGNVSITTTVADDSHNHTIANIDNLQSTLDGKSATSHTHTADNLISWANALFGTNSGGGVEFSYGSGSGVNVLTEISNMSQGLHTIYSIAGTTGNPKTGDSWRMLVHKTSTTIGWILAFDAQGSVYSNYQSAANTFKGWRCLYDAAPSALWTGGYYMSSTDGTPQTVTPSKKLSECRNGWVLIWSDYDPDTGTKNNTDIHYDYVFKKNCAGANWSGQCMLCDIPRYMGSNANDVDTERRILKAIYIHDDRIEGSYQGSYDERNDVVLRAVYEF